ncbi:MAG TPA: hypothetical protein PLB81_01325 [Deltaproteobacteria bacterium]|nr:hypothetical protein [Deltaproteobacteria bacterium]
MPGLAEISSRLVGLPYALGDAGAGMDCFSLIRQYAVLKGARPAEEFKGQRMDTYGALYLQDPAGAKALMLEYLNTFAAEVPPERACAGDILLLSLPDTDTLPFLAIAAGEQVLAAHPGRGVILISLQPYRIMRAWRCRQPSQP